jgi:hypothetical protein
MKKVFPLISTATGLPLTGKSIVLVRTFPDDGAELVCLELSNPGIYLATGASAGLYKVVDRTGNAMPGTDLDQTVDIAVATIMQQTLPNASSGFLAAPDRTFRAIGESDVTNLSADLGNLSTLINNAGTAILAEANARIVSEAAIETAVTASVNETLSTFLASVNTLISRIAAPPSYGIDVHVVYPFTGYLRDIATLTFRTMSQDGPMTFTRTKYQYIPSAVIPEIVYTIDESPLTPSVRNHAIWNNPAPLETVLPMAGYDHSPTIGITERIKNIDIVVVNEVSGPTRVLVLNLRVYQTKDFDHTVNINLDVSGSGLSASQFDEIVFYIFDGDKLACSAIPLAVGDAFTMVKSRNAIRINRMNGVLRCGMTTYPFPMVKA